MIDALDKITGEWERMQFFQELNDSFAALRKDPKGWKQETAERRTWDNTLNDDLTNESYL